MHRRKSDLSSARRADVHFCSTAVELPHIHVIHTAKHDQRCRSREAIPQAEGHAREEAISVIRMDRQAAGFVREL